MSTAGKRSRLARTERTPMSLDDFQSEVFRLDVEQQMQESYAVLIYGDSNAGKTVLASTLPGRTFWLIGEPGYKTAVRWGVGGYGRKITDAASAWAAVEWLEASNRDGAPRYTNLDWVVVDGATWMQDKFRLSYTAEAFDIDPTKRQHRNLPDRPDYFNTQNFLKAWIARLVDLPVNLLITAHAYRTEAGDADELLVYPGFQGKVTEVANSISGLMDAVGYLESRKLKSKRDPERTSIRRRLYFESPVRERDGQPVRYIVGEKFGGRLGAYIDQPTMSDLLARMEGKTDA